MDVANIRIHNSQDHPFQARPFEEAQVFEAGEDFSLQNGYIRAHFDKDGFLQDVTTLDDKVKTEMKLEFIKVKFIKGLLLKSILGQDTEIKQKIFYNICYLFSVWNEEKRRQVWCVFIHA